MRHVDVTDSDKALVYLADCTLATVCSMAMKKRRPAGEFRRQIGVAQKAIDWMRMFNIDPEGTRAEEVINNYDGEVARWAKFYID